MENKNPWSFCETPEEKCTMNFCDENGCQNRKRNLVEKEVTNDNESVNVSSETKPLQKIKMWLAVKIKWLRPYLLSLDMQEKLVMLEFRALARCLGLDITGMSDEEIKEGVSNVVKGMDKAGISADEAGEALYFKNHGV